MNSLEILRPVPSAPERCKERNATAVDLERATAVMLDIIARRSWDDQRSSFMAPNFQASVEHAGQRNIRSRDEYLRSFRDLVRAHKDYNVKLISISANVDEKNGTASVWMHVEISGDPESIRRENVSLVRWKRVQGCWECYKLDSVRGVHLG